MTNSSDDWARKKTDDLLRELNASASCDDNDTGLNDAVIGRLYSGLIQIGGFNLELPPGKWTTLAKSDISLPTATGVAYFLGRIQLRRLVGVVRAFAVKSMSHSELGIERIKGCEKDNPNNHYTYVEALTPFDSQACWLIQNYYTPPWQSWANNNIKIVDLDRNAARDMDSKGVTYPQDFVGVRFSCAEKWGLLEVTYLFSPEAEGISSNTVLSYLETDWHANNVARFPEKIAFIAKLKKWGMTFWPEFKTAFTEAK